MSIEELNNTKFNQGDRVIYKGVTYPVVVIEFDESLIGIPFDPRIKVEVADQITWVRCENCELIKQ
jgi:hypothetical protein